MQEKILELLRDKPGHVSGDQLSHHLGVSRQALWKHIQELKESGYDIAAVPHLGYQLVSSPDRLFAIEVQSGLKTKFVGKNIHYFDSISSTMDAAMQLGLKGESEGTLVLAETQIKGKGRLGRLWYSPKYKGIYFSLILRPKMPPSAASILTLLTAVSVCEAIKNNCKIDARIKWPNDVLLHNKKLAGILTELSAETDKVNFVSIGVGLNVNSGQKSLISGAVSLKEETGEQINRVSLLQEILRRIEANYLMLEHKGAKSVLDKWRELSISLSRRVKVYCQHKHIEGDAFDIDVDGGLLIRKDSGSVEKVTSGDVVHCR